MAMNHLQNQKQDTLTSKYTVTVLTPSERQSLRQDLKEAIQFSEGFFRKRAEEFRKQHNLKTL